MQRFVFLPSPQSRIQYLFCSWHVPPLIYIVLCLYLLYIICLYIYMNSKPITRIIHLHLYYVLYVPIICVRVRAGFIFYKKFFFHLFFHLPIPYYFTTRIILYTGCFSFPYKLLEWSRVRSSVIGSVIENILFCVLRIRGF